VIGVVLATQENLVASVVAAESWRATTGCEAMVLVDHPDLVEPLRRAGGSSEVLSWAQLGTAPGAFGAALRAVVDRRPDGDTVVVLPPTAFVLGVPEALIAASSRGAAVASRGTTAARLPADGLRPTGEDLAALGAVHPWLLALRAGDTRAARFLAWLDQADADTRAKLTPCHDDVAVVETPSLGLAWWNMEDRPLTWESGELLAAGVDVDVVDVDGWSPTYEHMLHPDMTRLLGSRDPALRRLVDEYAARFAVVAERVGNVRVQPWPADATLVELLARRPAVEREALLRDDAGARDAFMAWTEETDHEDTVWGLNRYLVAFRQARYDLQAAFPDINDRVDAQSYLEWARAGSAAEGIPSRFLGPVAVLDDHRDNDPHEPGGQHVENDGLTGVNVIGLFDEPALGIAEISRQVAAGLEASGLPVHRVSVDRRGRPDPTEGDDPLPYRVTVTCLNGDLMPVVRHRLRRRVRDDSHHVGVWWWEVPTVPESWTLAIDLIHEVWAGTQFVADAFSSRLSQPVRVVPLGLGRLEPAGTLPAAVARDPRPYVFVTFDYASRIERKNPIGAIRAFVEADLGPGVRLVVKSVNGDRWPREAERVRLACLDAANDDVLLIDERLPAGEQAALVEGAAAHLALHRSEGLGLTILEAMLRGTPVVATDYGGSTDLLDHATGWPVAWSEGRVPADCDPYPEGAPWAEPNVADAARALREVLVGGPDVAARVCAARTSAEARARRVELGDDLGRAARDAIALLRASGAGASWRRVLRASLHRA
jgi:glycosyltransferase involved in cell wall biosynthesis